MAESGSGFEELGGEVRAVAATAVKADTAITV